MINETPKCVDCGATKDLFIHHDYICGSCFGERTGANILADYRNACDTCGAWVHKVAHVELEDKTETMCMVCYVSRKGKK